MISATLSWLMSSLLLFVLWAIVALIALFLIALIVYTTGYSWTLGRHRALLKAFQDRQKSTEVTKHDTSKQ